MNGDGRYPKRLYARVARELAVVLRCTSTELSMMPVMVGKMLAPKKNTNQRHMYTKYLCSINGTGKAKIEAHAPSMTQRQNAFGELYPPSDPKTTPPTMTPAIGAVKQVKA